MDSVNDGGADLTPESGSGRSTDRVPGLDLQLTELIETVWVCERVWKWKAASKRSLGWRRSNGQRFTQPLRLPREARLAIEPLLTRS